MKTLTIKINEKTKQGKLLKDMIALFSKEKNGVEILNEDTTSGIDEALNDVKKGKINTYNSSTDLFKKVVNV